MITEKDYQELCYNYGNLSSINLPWYSDYRLSVSNIRHSVSYLINMNSVYIYNELQENITNKYVNIFGNLQHFSH